MVRQEVQPIFNNKTNMIKIALGMIVKGSDEEASAFLRCLDNVMPYVDKAFVTITHKKGEKRNKEVEDNCIVFNQDHERVAISDFEWIDDFAAARNFNFSQIPKEYTHILWCDADDVFRGLDRLKEIIARDSQKPKPSDGFGMWYLYHFDEYKQADVVHKKTMVIRNEDGASWVGELHEELVQKRNLDITMIDKYFNGGIDRMHLTEITRDQNKTGRNLKIAKAAIQKNPNEPRNYFNYSQSLHGAGKYKEAVMVYKKFLKISGSEEEKFLARLRMAEALDRLNDREGALENAYIALGMRPQYPDSYFTIGQLMYRYGRLDDAELYFLMGLKMKPKYNDVIVYNPRDYDYNPMMRLIDIYNDKGRPDLGLKLMKLCLDIYPNNEKLKWQYNDLTTQTARLTKVVEKLPAFEKMDDKELKETLAQLPEDIRSHPGICALVNKRFVKTESNGKELSIYCYPTAFDFNPELFETKGFGGSEEAVINIAKELAELGWEVTVYNRCGPVPKKHGKVWYKPFWMWNYRDVVDVLVVWRHPKPLDFELGAKKVFIDLHDVVPPEEFTAARITKMEKAMVKTNFHRSLFPNIPDDKIAVIPNGQDNSLFKGEGIKDPYLIINTSSPDRSMDVLPELFLEVKKQVPEAKMKWAYGWGNFDDIFKGDPLRQKWKKDVEEKIAAAGIECLGKIPQKDVAKLYEEATILAYPSEFAEIDCISVKKAQAAGCIPVTTDFGAFDESVQFGVKIPSKKTNKDWSKAYQFGYGITDPKMKKEWVDAVVELLKGDGVFTDGCSIPGGKSWARKFDWDKIAKRWNDVLK